MAAGPPGRSQQEASQWSPTGLQGALTHHLLAIGHPPGQELQERSLFSMHRFCSFFSRWISSGFGIGYSDHGKTGQQCLSKGTNEPLLFNMIFKDGILE